MQSIILLSGPIGAGKVTVARELIKTAKGPAANIEGDKFWFFIAKDKESKERHKNFRMIMTSMIAAAVPYAINDYEVIVDFSIPPWFLDTAQRIAKVREVPIDFVVIRPSEMVCAERAANRTEGQIKNYSTYSELYASFDGARPYMISDNEGTAISIAAQIRKGLEEGIFRI